MSDRRSCYFLWPPNIPNIGGDKTSQVTWVCHRTQPSPEGDQPILWTGLEDIHETSPSAWSHRPGRSRPGLHSRPIHLGTATCNLDPVLKHLQPSQVLVLHASGAYYQLLFQLKGTITPEQRIHLHCFQGNQQLFADWIGEFPNTYFGFTGLVQHFNESKKQALRSIPESRLLVETDSPYFKIGGNLPLLWWGW